MDNKKALKDRKFVQIDRDNFNDAMAKVNPKLNLKVENTLADDDSEIAVDLDFNNLGDFEPSRVVEQVEPLKTLMDARNKLRDLMTKVDRSEELENILEDVLQSTDSLNNLKSELGIEGDSE